MPATRYTITRKPITVNLGDGQSTTYLSKQDFELAESRIRNSAKIGKPLSGKDEAIAAYILGTHPDYESRLQDFVGLTVVEEAGSRSFAVLKEDGTTRSFSKKYVYMSDENLAELRRWHDAPDHWQFSAEMPNETDAAGLREAIHMQCSPTADVKTTASNIYVYAETISKDIAARLKLLMPEQSRVYFRSHGVVVSVRGP
jgi:hypothetical protein